MALVDFDSLFCLIKLILQALDYFRVLLRSMCLFIKLMGDFFLGKFGTKGSYDFITLLDSQGRNLLQCKG